MGVGVGMGGFGVWPYIPRPMLPHGPSYVAPPPHPPAFCLRHPPWPRRAGHTQNQQQLPQHINANEDSKIQVHTDAAQRAVGL